MDWLLAPLIRVCRMKTSVRALNYVHYLHNRRLATITQREAVAERLHKAHQVTAEEQQRLNYEMFVIQMNLVTITSGYSEC